MNLKFKTIVLITGILLSSIAAFGQEGSSEKKESKTEISLEIDPATFLFKGYGFHLRIKPKNSQHLLLGAGTYAMDFPSILVDLNAENKGKGWNVRLNQGYGLFGEYHFSEVNKKWFVGTQLAIQEYKIEKDFYEGSAKFNNSLLMAYGGYTFRPFKNNMYIKTWAGIAYTSKISGDNNLGNAAYDISPMLLFSAVHLGYKF